MVQEVVLKQSPGELEEPVDVGEFALRWLQIDPTPRLIVDPSLWLVWRNLAAEQLLLDCPDLDARDGQLSADDRASNLALTDLVTNASDDMTTCTVPCMDGDGHLLFHARRLSVHDRTRIALCIKRTGSSHRSSYADFSQAFALTASEFQIVKLLVAGQTADAIAVRSGSSIGTVRSHIRSVYNKLDVSSREMMFHRLQPFRIV